MSVYFNHYRRILTNITENDELKKKNWRNGFINQCCNVGKVNHDELNLYGKILSDHRKSIIFKNVWEYFIMA